MNLTVTRMFLIPGVVLAIALVACGDGDTTARSVDGGSGAAVVVQADDSADVALIGDLEHEKGETHAEDLIPVGNTEAVAVHEQEEDEDAAAVDGTGHDEDSADVAAAHHHESDEADLAIEGAPELVLKALDIQYSPTELRLTVGEAVNLKLLNQGALDHDFLIEGTDFHLHVAPGGEGIAALQIDTPGTHRFYCSVPGHRGAGMEGMIVVEAETVQADEEHERETAHDLG